MGQVSLVEGLPANTPTLLKQRVAHNDGFERRCFRDLFSQGGKQRNWGLPIEQLNSRGCGGATIVIAYYCLIRPEQIRSRQKVYGLWPIPA